MRLFNRILTAGVIAAIMAATTLASTTSAEALGFHFRGYKHARRNHGDCPWKMVPYHGHLVGRHICGGGKF